MAIYTRFGGTVQLTARDADFEDTGWLRGKIEAQEERSLNIMDLKADGGAKEILDLIESLPIRQVRDRPR